MRDSVVVVTDINSEQVPRNVTGSLCGSTTIYNSAYSEEQNFVRQNIAPIVTIQPLTVNCDPGSEFILPDGTNTGLQRLTSGYWLTGSVAEVSVPSVSYDTSLAYLNFNSQEYITTGCVVQAIRDYRQVPGDGNSFPVSSGGDSWSIDIESTATSEDDIIEDRTVYISYIGQVFYDEDYAFSAFASPIYGFPSSDYYKATPEFGAFNISVSDLTPITNFIRRQFASELSNTPFGNLSDNFTATTGVVELVQKYEVPSDAAETTNSTQTIRHVPVQGCRLGSEDR